MSPAETLAGFLAASDAWAPKQPFTSSIEALTAELRRALPDDPAVTAPLITAISAVKDARPDLNVKVTESRHFLFIQLPLEGQRHE